MKSSTVKKAQRQASKKAKPVTKKSQKEVTVLKGLKPKAKAKALQRFLTQTTPQKTSGNSNSRSREQKESEKLPKWEQQHEKFHTYLTLKNSYEQAVGTRSTFFQDMIHRLESKKELTENMEKAIQRAIEDDKKRLAVSPRTDEHAEALRKYLGVEKAEKNEIDGTPMKLRMKAWWCKQNSIESRIITGVVTRETEKAYFFIGHADMLDSATCWRCGKNLTNPASYFAGVGETCAKKLGVPYPHEVALMTEKEKTNFKKKIKQVLKKQTIEGWIPKSQVVEVLNGSKGR
jgi:hypothetical protein